MTRAASPNTRVDVAADPERHNRRRCLVIHITDRPEEAIANRGPLIPSAILLLTAPFALP
jgi:hypothetical protein